MLRNGTRYEALTFVQLDYLKRKQLVVGTRYEALTFYNLLQLYFSFTTLYAL